MRQKFLLIATCFLAAKRLRFGKRGKRDKDNNSYEREQFQVLALQFGTAGAAEAPLDAPGVLLDAEKTKRARSSVRLVGACA